MFIITLEMKTAKNKRQAAVFGPSNARLGVEMEENLCGRKKFVNLQKKFFELILMKTQEKAIPDMKLHGRKSLNCLH